MVPIRPPTGFVSKSPRRLLRLAPGPRRSGARMALANADCASGGSTDALAVRVGDTFTRDYSADFGNARGAVIAAPTIVAGDTSTFRIRITRVNSGDDLTYAFVALPTCLSAITGISTTNSTTGGTPDFVATLVDNTFRFNTKATNWRQMASGRRSISRRRRLVPQGRTNSERPHGRTALLKLPRTTSSTLTGQPTLTVIAAGPCAGQPAGFVCRASAGACDAAETCDGTNAACPADAKLAAGTECRASAGQCAVRGGKAATARTARVRRTASRLRGRRAAMPAPKCTNQDTCNAMGSCTDNGFKAAGTSSPATPIRRRMRPDTCDAAGSCVDRKDASAGRCARRATPRVVTRTMSATAPPMPAPRSWRRRGPVAATPIRRRVRRQHV